MPRTVSHCGPHNTVWAAGDVISKKAYVEGVGFIIRPPVPIVYSGVCAYSGGRNRIRNWTRPAVPVLVSLAFSWGSDGRSCRELRSPSLAADVLIYFLHWLLCLCLKHVTSRERNFLLLKCVTRRMTFEFWRLLPHYCHVSAWANQLLSLVHSFGSVRECYVRSVLSVRRVYVKHILGIQHYVHNR